jgi:hypothetical protein
MSSERFGQKVLSVKKYFERLVAKNYTVFVPLEFAP